MTEGVADPYWALIRVDWGLKDWDWRQVGKVNVFSFFCCVHGQGRGFGGARCAPLLAVTLCQCLETEMAL